MSYGGYVYNLDLERDGGDGIMLANGIVVGITGCRMVCRYADMNGAESSE